MNLVLNLVFKLSIGIEKAKVEIKNATASTVGDSNDPNNMIDSDPNTFHSSQYKKDSPNLGWVQLELTTIQNITKIYITTRKDRFKFKNVTVRAGNQKIFANDSRAQQKSDILKNKLCNTFHGPVKNGEIMKIYCKTPISGTVVTIQILDNDVGYIDIAEVEVYRSILVGGM